MAICIMPSDIKTEYENKETKMKTSLTIILLTLTLLLAPIASAGTNTYPPENAADLYRKAIKLYQPNKDEIYAIDQLLNGEKEDYPVIEKHIEANRKVLNLALEASKIKNCDWNFTLPAYDPADPNELRNALEHYRDNDRAMRKISWLMLADAKIQAHRSETNTAIDRIMTTYAISRHMDSNYLYGWLSSMLVQGQTDNLLISMLSEKNIDLSMLNHIETSLNLHVKATKPLTNTFEHEMQHQYKLLEKVNFELIIEVYSKDLRHPFYEPNVVDEIFDSKNAEYNVFDRDYFQVYQQRLRKTFNLSYSQAIAAFEKINDELFADGAEYVLSDNKTSKHYTAFIIRTFATPPFLWSIEYTMEIHKKTQSNAILTAIELYKTKAKTDKLPDTLPPNSPKDLFSGKDFAYEKTETGFILRCRAKDLSKDTIREYEFKVKVAK